MKSLIKLLIRKKIKISVVESCTGGLLASAITSISGASKIFSLGLITYSNQAKIKILRVNKNIIKRFGAVSYECCYAMVNNLSRISRNLIPLGGIKIKNLNKLKNVYCEGFALLSEIKKKPAKIISRLF